MRILNLYACLIPGIISRKSITLTHSQSTTWMGHSEKFDQLTTGRPDWAKYGSLHYESNLIKSPTYNTVNYCDGHVN